MSLESAFKLVDIKYLEELPNAELIKAVQELQAEVKRMELENQIFENFLIANEPMLIASMGQTLEAVKKLQFSYKPQFNQPQLLVVASSSESVSKTSGLSAQEDSRSITLESSVNKSKSDKGPRINFSQKTDLVMREIEEMQVNLRNFIAISHRRKSHFKAEIEESNIRAQEVKDSRDDFEQIIVIGAVEKLTQKIPAEKFVR
ncbi:hypothetical protein Trydic_g19988 [Trypoxylus dichotomus]